MRPVALCTVPARNVGMEPRRRQAANVFLGPKRSQEGPATMRTRKLWVGVMMEFMW